MRTASRQQTSSTSTNFTTNSSPAGVTSEALWALLHGVVDAQLDEPPTEKSAIKDPQIDQIKEIDPDQIARVSGSPAGTRSPARTSSDAFDTLIKHPAWSCRQAARELGVSVGTIHNWRELLKLGARPQAPGRPEIPLDLRAREALKRWHRLVVADPRNALVRIVRRLWNNPRTLGPAALRSLHTALCETPIVIAKGDGAIGNLVHIEPYSVADDAIGTDGRSFVEYLIVRARGRANETSETPNDDDDNACGETFRFEDFQMSLPPRAKARGEWEGESDDGVQ